MQREFNSRDGATSFRAVVTVGDVLGRKLLQGLLESRGAFGVGGSSRRLKSIFIEGDVLARVEAGLRREDAMPAWALADVLQELGWDDGFTDAVRSAA